MKVTILPRVEEDLDRVRRFLRPLNPEIARRAIKTIKSGFANIGASPDDGKEAPGRDEDYRERTVDFGSSGYIILYRIDDLNDQVVIVGLRHAKELAYAFEQHDALRMQQHEDLASSFLHGFSSSEFGIDLCANDENAKRSILECAEGMIMAAYYIQGDRRRRFMAGLEEENIILFNNNLDELFEQAARLGVELSEDAEHAYRLLQREIEDLIPRSNYCYNTPSNDF